MKIDGRTWESRGHRDQFVYWLYDAAGTCLYVGCTTQPLRRWKRHCMERRAMVAQVAYRRMSGPYEFRVARRIEREQQDLLKPIYDHRLANRPSYAKAAAS